MSKVLIFVDATCSRSQPRSSRSTVLFFLIIFRGLVMIDINTNVRWRTAVSRLGLTMTEQGFTSHSSVRPRQPCSVFDFCVRRHQPKSSMYSLVPKQTTIVVLATSTVCSTYHATKNCCLERLYCTYSDLFAVQYLIKVAF